MEFGMNQQESYADRRKLFKNIWDTAMKLEDKNANEVISKPKVIKTLRLDEVDRCPVGRKKKQRLKNLRAVCNKLLDFCDRQDADDLFYQQMVAEGKDVTSRKPEPNVTMKKPKAKLKRKVLKAKSVFLRVTQPVAPKPTTSERQGDCKGNETTSKLNNHDLDNELQRQNRKGIKKPIFPIYVSPGEAKFKYITVTRAIPSARASKKLLQMHKINIT